HPSPSPYPFIESVAFGPHTMWLLGSLAPCPGSSTECAHLWRSGDGGHRWTSTSYVATGPADQAFGDVIAVDDRHVFAAYDGTVAESTDAGAHFAKVLRRAGAQIGLLGNDVWAF